MEKLTSQQLADQLSRFINGASQEAMKELATAMKKDHLTFFNHE